MFCGYGFVLSFGLQFPRANTLVGNCYRPKDCAFAVVGAGTYSWGGDCPGHRRRTTFSMMLSMRLSYLSLSSVRRHLQSGQDGFLPIHSRMHFSQYLCVQFIDTHVLRSISIQIVHLNSSINFSPPSTMLSIAHFSPSSFSVSAFLAASAGVKDLSLSVLGPRMVVSGLVFRGARSVLDRPHPSLARSFASRLSPHLPPVC